MIEDRIGVGSWVRSVEVGRRGTFVGQVTRWQQGSLVVRDSEGRHWIRSLDQLELVREGTES